MTVFACQDCKGTGVGDHRKRKHAHKPCACCGGSGKRLDPEADCGCGCHAGKSDKFACCFAPCCKNAGVRVGEPDKMAPGEVLADMVKSYMKNEER